VASGCDQQRSNSLHLNISGVLFPTLAASSQWVFGRFRVVRLNFVKPPLPHSTGSPLAFSRS
jgi:hypothetical protein